MPGQAMVKSSSYDLLPGRIQSEWSVLFERTAAVVIGLIVTAAVIIAMVEGFANKRSGPTRRTAQLALSARPLHCHPTPDVLGS